MIGSNYNSVCQKAQLHYYELIDKQACDLVPSDIIEHVKNCSYCQGQLDILKTTLAAPIDPAFQSTKNVIGILDQQLSYIEKPVTCNIVKPFLPSLLHDRVNIPTPITVHLDNCIQCRNDLQSIKKLDLNSSQLAELSRIFSAKSTQQQNKLLADMSYLQKEGSADAIMFPAAILAIAQRPDSSIATVYKIDNSIKDGSGQNDDPYAAFPIKVELKKVKLQNRLSAIKKFLDKDASSLLSFNYHPVVKAAIATAAAIMIGFMIFHTPVVTAVNFKDICNAVDKVRNVHITHFDGQMQILQQLWISKKLNIYMTKTGDRIALWNISAKVRKIKDSSDGTRETDVIPEEVLPGLKKKLSASLGMVPLHGLSDMPKGQWNQLETQSLNVLPNIDVYELSWNINGDGFICCYKWRVFVDHKTDLPQRTEYYFKRSIDEEYDLQSIEQIEYLTNSQMKDVVDQFD